MGRVHGQNFLSGLDYWTNDGGKDTAFSYSRPEHSAATEYGKIFSLSMDILLRIQSAVATADAIYSAYSGFPISIPSMIKNNMRKERAR